jgi:lipopolysaccharide export system protein LptA
MRQDNPLSQERARQAGVISTMVFGLILSLLSTPLWAERADRLKPMTIEADHFVHDEARRISRFQGKVILNKGTLQIRADELEVIEDRAGYQSATALGKPVHFKQKREAVNEMIEGNALKLFYSAREETVRLEESAEMRRVIEGKAADLMQGELIVYDSRKERYEVSRSAASPNAAPQATNPSGRVRVVIQPKPESKP